MSTLRFSSIASDLERDRNDRYAVIVFGRDAGVEMPLVDVEICVPFAMSKQSSIPSTPIWRPPFNGPRRCSPTTPPSGSCWSPTATKTWATPGAKPSPRPPPA